MKKQKQTNSRFILTIIAVVVIISLALTVACGGGDDDDTTAVPTLVPTATAAPDEESAAVESAVETEQDTAVRIEGNNEGSVETNQSTQTVIQTTTIQIDCDGSEVCGQTVTVVGNTTETNCTAMGGTWLGGGGDCEVRTTGDGGNLNDGFQLNLDFGD